ncbi:MAG TPA: hypothetical protein VHU83_11670 [Bryobacteraceae bacterium]|jgi:hypothetical protein|nr:hypothetical protein [Bryobacteraceae bacterium]
MPQLLPLLLYREHQNSASLKELAIAFKLPEFLVKEKLAATYFYLERQVRVETDALAA